MPVEGSRDSGESNMDDQERPEEGLIHSSMALLGSIFTGRASLKICMSRCEPRVVTSRL